ncbi:MAG: beta-L-arabinofuranosidase domain-containing protein [Thermogutta sp.]
MKPITLKLWTGLALLIVASFDFRSEGIEPLTYQSPAVQIEYQVPLSAYTFDLRDVRVTGGVFRHAMDLDKRYLLSLDPNRLLHVFRINAGLPSDAQPLGGWEDPKCELRGHFVGHYLSACSLMYASTGDVALRERVDVIVQELAKCQEKLGHGYLSAFPEEFFDRVETTGRVWAPYYTLHKILAGLLDAYLYCDNKQALTVAKNVGDWVIARNRRLSDQQMQRMLGVEHGGMNEALANLYALTGESKYLEVAERFNHLAVLEPLARGEDILTGLHANTQIPKFIGAARLFEITGKDWYHKAATHFWNYVVYERSYVIGGNSDNEHFSPKERLSQALGPNTTETCNTYNMLKLTRHLFCWQPAARYFDYYERALYNHILASQDPTTGMMCYYVPLRSGSQKSYSQPLDSFWCCTGTGVENHAKYGDSIYFHDGKGTLFVNLFIPSELHWWQTGLVIKQETDFPFEPRSKLLITCEKPSELTISIRRPGWVIEGFQVKVNGEVFAGSSDENGFVPVRRLWKSGDRIEIDLPMALGIEAFRDNPHRLAFLYGPLVLAAELPRLTLEQRQMGRDAKESKYNSEIPMIVAESIPLDQFQPVKSKPCTWQAPANLFRSLLQDPLPPITLEPFFAIHQGRRYVVYWDQVSPDHWQELTAAYEQDLAKWRELEKKTIDYVRIGDAESEKRHNLQGENTSQGVFQGRAWRHATSGGWFSYELMLRKVPGSLASPESSANSTEDPSKSASASAARRPIGLLVEYWGSDSGNRVFDILVNGKKIATERLNNNRPGEFYIETYSLAEELVEGLDRITIRFQAHPGATAGGIFALRVVNIE